MKTWKKVKKGITWFLQKIPNFSLLNNLKFAPKIRAPRRKYFFQLCRKEGWSGHFESSRGSLLGNGCHGLRMVSHRWERWGHYRRSWQRSPWWSSGSSRSAPSSWWPPPPRCWRRRWGENWEGKTRDRGYQGSEDEIIFQVEPKKQNGKLTWIQPVPATWIKTTYATLYHPYMFGSNQPGWQKLSELEKERDCLLQRLVLVQKKNGPFLVGKVGKEGTVECGLSVASI